MILRQVGPLIPDVGYFFLRRQMSPALLININLLLAIFLIVGSIFGAKTCPQTNKYNCLLSLGVRVRHS